MENNSQFKNEPNGPKKKKSQHEQPSSPYNPKPVNKYKEQHEASMTNKKAPHKNRNPKGTEKPKPKGYPTDDLFKKMDEHKKSVKIEPLKKKTTESVLKEKMDAKEKLKKKSPTTRARTPLPKKRKKK
jgi:hypothetical protein